MPWLMAFNPRRPFGILLRLRHPEPSVQGNVVGPVLHGGPPRIILVHEQSGRRSRGQLRHHWLRAQVIFYETLACYRGGMRGFAGRAIVQRAV